MKYFVKSKQGKPASWESSAKSAKDMFRPITEDCEERGNKSENGFALHRSFGMTIAELRSYENVDLTIKVE